MVYAHPIVCGGSVLIFVWYALLYVHSSFGNHLDEEERAGCVDVIVSQVYCYCKYSVALLHGAMGWHAVCDCGIS